MVTLRSSVLLGVSLSLAACGVQTPDLPLDQETLEAFWQHSDWRPKAGVAVDVHQAAPGREDAFAQAINRGDVKVILGDSTNVSTAQGGFGLRMDLQRQDLARITKQVIMEEGDHFDFVVVFPAFQDQLNPGFAYFSTIQSAETGTGQPPINMSSTFGSSGRLQGFLNMNEPDAYTQVDGLAISDPESAIYPIMGQELSHRWLAFATFKKAGFDNGNVSGALLGRDNAHWSVLLHTGPVDMSGDIYSSVQDGVAWVDNGDGTFTAADMFSDQRFTISQRSRYSPLDLYLMGLNTPEETIPFFLIDGATASGRDVPANTSLPRGVTVRGTRVDLGVEHLIAAMGPRVPDTTTSQKDFNVAMVVLAAPGQTLQDVNNTVLLVDSFRTQWEQRFHTWTNGRATVCTALSGNCTTARLGLGDVEIVDASGDGSLTPGEAYTLHVPVENRGSLLSTTATLSLDVGGTQQMQDVAPIAPGASTTITFQGSVAATQECGAVLAFNLSLAVPEVMPVTLSLERPVGTLEALHLDLETNPGWTTNAGHQDTAATGQWAYGVAHQTDLRRFGSAGVMMQPGDDASPQGTHAFFTAPGDAMLSPSDISSTDVDDGTTSLQTTAFDLSGMHQPTFMFSTWHVALVVDVQAGQIRHGDGDDLVTLASKDGSAWVEVDRDDTNEFVWRPKTVHLKDFPELQGASQLFLRFVVGDEGPEQNVVEAGVDEVRVMDVAAACLPPVETVDAGSGSSSSGGSGGDTGTVGVGGVRPCACAQVPSLVVPVPGLVLLGLLARRRRR